MMQSTASEPIMPPGSSVLARWPQWRWVLLVLAPLLAALGLALQAQHDTQAAQALAQETEQLKARAALVLKNTASSPDTQGTPQGFKSEFPAYALRLERLQDFLARLAQLGPNTPNTTPPTSYRQSALGDSGLVAYTVSLATTTTYGAWRDFVDDVLWADPALALTSLSLNRSDANAPLVRVQAVFTFYMQGPEPIAPSTPITSNTPGVPMAPSATGAQPVPQVSPKGSAP